MLLLGTGIHLDGLVLGERIAQLNNLSHWTDKVLGHQTSSTKLF